MKTDKGRTAKALLGLMFLCAVVEGPHSAVQAQQAVTKPLEHEVGVVLKLVHVYVTDKKGRPVPDLARDDFSLLDNGTPVTITEFEKHTLSATASEPVPEPAPAAPVVRPASRKFILFFDLAFNDAWGVTKAKEAAAHFLDSEVRPEDEVGAISYSLFGGVKVHEFMTKDHGKVRDILDEIDQGGITGRAEEIEAWYWRTISASMPNPDNPARGGQDPLKLREAMADRQQLKEQTQTYVLSLTTLAKALRLLPGQKHFILFSRGVPTSVIYGNQAGFRDFQMEMHPTLAKTQFDMGDPKLKASNEGMFKEFAAAGCAFYAFDTHASAKGADLFGYDTRGGNPTSLGALYGDSTNIFNDPKATGGNYLKRFSDITGGRYFSNIRAFEKNLRSKL
jgi:VWFA-related protein